MEGLTYKKINAIKKKILEKVSIDASKLKEYRYVDELHELKTGGFVRWVNVNEPDKLTNGGFVVRVDIEDEGTKILCKKGNLFFQFWMDECIVFQKIPNQEHIILIANEL
jgi:hypothetical protein